MNFGWCGQSCNSTSRVFLHASIYDRVVEGIVDQVKTYKPGLPTRMDTTMGAIISAAQRRKILDYIASAHREGARLIAGGSAPADPALADGFFIEPTVFVDVTPEMTIAKEEIFGPVLAILKWDDEETMFDAVNGTEYGLTAAVFTRDISTGHRAATRIDAGFVWINTTGIIPPGASFGGYKMSGVGRESSIGELFAFTQEKNICMAI